MDKRVLLVLLCVQVFLLITTFTATDAAALVKDDQQQSLDPGVPFKIPTPQSPLPIDKKKVEETTPAN